MKTPILPTNSDRNNAGIALVIVLAFLVLLSGIVVAFFSSVGTELSSSKTAADTANTRQLADSAVNVVMAQMVDATKKQDTSSQNLAWASQPGMIRTFDSSGKPKNFFKLYSSDKMVVDGSKFSPSDDSPPVDWKEPVNSELYTDLNTPVVDSKGLLVYPIIDPSADGTAAPGRVKDDFKVDGFSLNSPPGFVKGKPESAVNNRAPMPVKWIYVLKEGQLKPPSDPNAGTVTVKDATKENPIVGRIAFWADDETCKVNINTASEGTFWDVPRIFSLEDFGTNSGAQGFAVSQPLLREFQRYPGHPATTCLSPVFGSLLPVSYPYPANPTGADGVKLDPYYKIAPRIAGEGSKGGSVPAIANNPPVVTDADRLYTTVDELMFTPNLAAASRIPNTSTTAAPTKITKGILEKAKFFLTANSSAPEVTLNNTPRVAVWPVAVNPAQRTAYDALLAFCSTIGGKEYYFTRTPRTGARSSTADYGARNQKLYQYLQTLTKTDVPGFGGNFLKKYGAGPANVTDCDQILTYIYDYIRCTNLQDSTAGANASYTPAYSTLGAGEVVPISISDSKTQGFGRFLSISSANIIFYGTKADSTGKVTAMRALFFLQFSSPGQGLAAMRSGMKYTVTGMEKLQVTIGSSQVGLNLPAGGTNRMTRADMAVWGGRDVGGSESAQQAVMKGTSGDWPDSVAGKDSKSTGYYPFFSISDVAVPTGQTGFTISTGADVTVKIESDEDAGGASTLVQTIHLKFPLSAPGPLKLPGITSGTSYNFGSRSFGGQAGSENWFDNKDTIVSLQVGGAEATANASPAKADDPTAGDTRMVNSMSDVPADRFRAHNDYTTANAQYAHSLTLSTGELLNSGGGLAPKAGTFGTLAPGANYLQSTGSIWRQPDVPGRVPAAKGVQRKDGGPGDWDTGFGDQRDGAYINKPDEGDTAFSDAVGNTQRLPYMLGYAKGYASATSTYFSPNRQIPSPLVFGSIPTGVQRMQPWQTLLFHHRPEDMKHPGYGTPVKPDAGQGYTLPPDHLIADLFWMPVVEPYAISQPFATNGKINMNYQILPFTYINRSTGLYAVMKATKFMALPVSDATTYKPRDQSANSPTNANRRRTINMVKTLAAFEDKFTNDKEIFRSASQICEMDLVPPEVSSYGPPMATFWNSNKLTGDNLREKPYVDLYSRLTTKSNTFTVHVRVQTLKKAPGGEPAKWDATRDKVVGEYRGSSILERYIDLNDPTNPIKDFAADPTLNIDQYYKMRVVSTKRFSP